MHATLVWGCGEHLFVLCGMKQGLEQDTVEPALLNTNTDTEVDRDEADSNIEGEEPSGLAAIVKTERVQCILLFYCMALLHCLPVIVVV